MSKKKKAKKKQPAPKKKSPKKTIIAVACVAVVAALAVVGGILLDRLTNIKYADFVGRTLHSVSARDSKGKEVALKDIYENAERYDSYQGSLDFREDSTFSMWMGMGPDDGTHDGTFTYNMGDNVIKAEYMSGDKIEFKIARNKDGTLKHIEAPYKKYTVYFS